MDTLIAKAFRWADPDRRDLYRALSIMVSDRITAARANLSIEILLSDLELYDDPRQGCGHWLHADEAPLVDDLGKMLHHLVGGSPTTKSGGEALRSAGWNEACRKAETLLNKIKANGARHSPT